MAGKKKKSSHRDRKLLEEPTGDSNRTDREMPVLSPHALQLTLKELAEDDNRVLTGLDKRLQRLNENTPILETFDNKEDHRSIHDMSRSPIEIDHQLVEEDLSQAGARGAQDGGQFENPDDQETIAYRNGLGQESSEGLVSSDHEDPVNPVNPARRGRKRSLPPGYRIPMKKQRERSRSGEHDRRYARHGEQRGRLGLRRMERGRKRP